MFVVTETEQRELGELKGAAGWSEVMDMGTRKVYFWHRDTNEVAWDPPPGSTPRYGPLNLSVTEPKYPSAVLMYPA